MASLHHAIIEFNALWEEHEQLEMRLVGIERGVR